MSPRARRFALPAIVALAVFAVAGAAAVAVGDCPSASAAEGPGVAESPNWLVGFHEVPSYLDEGGRYMTGKVHQVDLTLRFISVTAHDPLFPKLACADPAVRYLEPNGIVTAD